MGITIEQRIEWRKKVIIKLQEELARLEEEAKPKPRHGDIVKTPTTGLRLIVDNGRGDFVSYDETGQIQCDDMNDVQKEYTHGYYTVVGNVFGPAPEGK
jgi:hypothetical protein